MDIRYFKIVHEEKNCCNILNVIQDAFFLEFFILSIKEIQAVVKSASPKESVW